MHCVNGKGRLRITLWWLLKPPRLSRRRRRSDLVKKLISGAQLADDLLGAVVIAFHGASPDKVWPIGKLP